MQSVGLSPWQRFKVLFATTSNVSAYNNALGGDTEFLETEASVFFRESTGWPWAERPESEPVPGSVHFTRPRSASAQMGASPSLSRRSPTASTT